MLLSRIRTAFSLADCCCKLSSSLVWSSARFGSLATATSSEPKPSKSSFQPSLLGALASCNWASNAATCDFNFLTSATCSSFSCSAEFNLERNVSDSDRVWSSSDCMASTAALSTRSSLVVPNASKSSFQPSLLLSLLSWTWASSVATWFFNVTTRLFCSLFSCSAWLSLDLRVSTSDRVSSSSDATASRADLLTFSSASAPKASKSSFQPSLPLPLPASCSWFSNDATCVFKLATRALFSSSEIFNFETADSSCKRVSSSSALTASKAVLSTGSSATTVSVVPKPSKSSFQPDSASWTWFNELKSLICSSLSCSAWVNLALTSSNSDRACASSDLTASNSALAALRTKWSCSTAGAPCSKASSATTMSSVPKPVKSSLHPSLSLSAAIGATAVSTASVWDSNSVIRDFRPLMTLDRSAIPCSDSFNRYFRDSISDLASSNWPDSKFNLTSSSSRLANWSSTPSDLSLSSQLTFSNCEFLSNMTVSSSEVFSRETSSCWRRSFICSSFSSISRSSSRLVTWHLEWSCSSLLNSETIPECSSCKET